MGSVEKLETKFGNGNAHFWNHWRASASSSNGIMETYPRDSYAKGQASQIPNSIAVVVSHASALAGQLLWYQRHGCTSGTAVGPACN